MDKKNPAPAPAEIRITSVHRKRQKRDWPMIFIMAAATLIAAVLVVFFVMLATSFMGPGF